MWSSRHVSPRALRLLRFWVCESASITRCEYLAEDGVYQDVADVHAPTEDTDWRPSVGKFCPDEIAEELAELAYDVIDQGTSDDPRFAGWDSTEDAAWMAAEAWSETSRSDAE